MAKIRPSKKKEIIKDKNDKNGIKQPKKPNTQIQKKYKENNEISKKLVNEVEQKCKGQKWDAISIKNFIEFQGSTMFRTRLLCSVLCGKAIKIDNIRSLETYPGQRDYEISFLRQMDKITNGTRVKINSTGTTIQFVPGLQIGNTILDMTHDCLNQKRSVGYFLEPQQILGQFCKEPQNIRFINCITNSDSDISIDIIRAVSIPQQKYFGIGITDIAGNTTEKPTITIKKRGSLPDGGGEVQFSCPIIKEQKSVTQIETGKIKKIRGVAYTARCTQTFATRMITSARDIYSNFSTNIHIYTDHYKGKDGGKSPGYGISLAAQTTTGCVISSQCTSITPNVADTIQKDTNLSLMYINTINDTESNLQDDEYKARLLHEPLDKRSGGAITSNTMNTAEDFTQMYHIPENVGRTCARRQLAEISEDGCIDSAHQSLFCLLMALSPEDVSKVRIGKLTEHCVQTLRILNTFWGITFNVQQDEHSGAILLSCLGIGFINLSRKTV